MGWIFKDPFVFPYVSVANLFEPKYWVYFYMNYWYTPILHIRLCTTPHIFQPCMSLITRDDR